jgi:hypothetical protein
LNRLAKSEIGSGKKSKTVSFANLSGTWSFMGWLSLLLQFTSLTFTVSSMPGINTEDLTIAKEGAQLFKGALSLVALADLGSALADQPQDYAGVRLSGVPRLRPFLVADGPVGKIPASITWHGMYSSARHTL